MSVRVIRLMEYVYPDVESAREDMSHWAVQTGMVSFKPGYEISSTIILNPTPFEKPIIKQDGLDLPLKKPELGNPSYTPSEMIEKLKLKTVFPHASINTAVTNFFSWAHQGDEGFNGELENDAQVLRNCKKYWTNPPRK